MTGGLISERRAIKITGFDGHSTAIVLYREMFWYPVNTNQAFGGEYQRIAGYTLSCARTGRHETRTGAVLNSYTLLFRGRF